MGMYFKNLFNKNEKNVYTLKLLGQFSNTMEFTL